MKLRASQEIQTAPKTHVQARFSVWAEILFPIAWNLFRLFSPFARAENPYRAKLAFSTRVELRPGLNPSPVIGNSVHVKWIG